MTTGESTVERGATGTACSSDPRAEETPHTYLRRVSRPWHDDVEAAFAPFDLQTREGLAGFLLRQALAVLPMERALDRSGVADWLADWPARRRGAALATDLLRLGRDVPDRPEMPGHATAYHMLGALYVLEGSKLGGRVLYRRAQASPDPEVRSATLFLGHRQEQGWARFLAVLDAVPTSPEAWTFLREGARGAFDTFGAAARDAIEHRDVIVPPRSDLYHQAHA